MSLSAAALGRFTEYPWPGNIRELENAIERIVVLTPGRDIGLNDLAACLQIEATAPLERISLVLPPTGVSLREVEKALFREALKKNHWNRSQAARYLGVSRDTLNYRMRKYGLDRVKAGRLALHGVKNAPMVTVVQ